MTSKPTRVQPVPGLTVEVSRAASSRYGYVRHTATDLLVVNGGHAPIRSVKALTDAVEAHLTGLDWSGKDAAYYQAMPEADALVLRRACRAVTDDCCAPRGWWGAQ